MIRAAMTEKLPRRFFQPGRSAYDRRCVAVHEAGHVVITRLCGLELSSAWISRADDGNWMGRVQIETWSVRQPTMAEKRFFSVAGAVAEACWEDRSGDVDCIIDSMDWYDPEIMSDTDWEGSSCAPGVPDDALFTAVEKVARLFRRECVIGKGRPPGPLWSALIETSRALIVNARPDWHEHGSDWREFICGPSDKWIARMCEESSA
jgi:hypothetical protein